MVSLKVKSFLPLFSFLLAGVFMASDVYLGFEVTESVLSILTVMLPTTAGAGVLASAKDVWKKNREK